MDKENPGKRDNKFKKLTPISNVKLKIYNEALNYIFDNKDIKNVAISGPYSSGKSSVIESYKKNSNKHFLHISLANFSEPQAKENLDENTFANSKADKTLLEGQILNQLIHQIKPGSIPQTKFKIKQKTNTKTVIQNVILSIVFFALSLYIYSFNSWSSFVRGGEKWVISTLEWTTSDFALMLSGIVWFIILGIATFHIIMLQKNKNFLRRLKLQGSEIEIFEENDESFFDKYLNEVLYLFEHSYADAIVFEDMDRHNANQIFVKLREINTLINNKYEEDEKEPIRFIYLIKDDIFTSKDRTKFFDFILPVLPVIDGSNSFDKLIDYFTDGNILNLFDEKFLSELSLYIDDMRVLKNIYNEFIIYYNRILSIDDVPNKELYKRDSKSKLINLDSNKLLAIIVFKNIFPKDFSDLHLRMGFMYSLFNNKALYIKQETIKIDEKIMEIEKEIKLAEKENINSIHELDAIYLMLNYNITSVASSNISNFNNRAELIEAIINNPDQVYYSHYHSNYKLDVTSEIEKVRKNEEYITRKKSIEIKMNNQIDKMKNEHQRLIKEKNSLQSSKLKNMITKDNINSIFSITYINQIGEENTFDEIRGSNYFSLIKYLVRYGYIDEHYSDYMTYFYGSSLSRIDKNFLLSVTDQIPKEYLYKLDNPEKIISRLKLSHFDNVEVLNFDLLDYIIETKSKHINYFSRFLHQLQDTKNLQFIISFMEHEEETSIGTFIKELNKIWPKVFQNIVEKDTINYLQIKLYSRYSLYYSDELEIERLNANNCLTTFISESHDYLDIENPENEKLIAGFLLLGVKFEWIIFDNANPQLFQEVYENNIYKLTFNFVCLILEEVYGLDESDNFKNKHYSLILSNEYEPLVQYVNSNMDIYILEILENCDKHITDIEDVALSIINNSDIDDMNKKTYITYLKTVIKYIDRVDDINLWKYLLEANVVENSEYNILKYFCQFEMDRPLIEFINESTSILKFKSELVDEEFETKFFEAVLISNKLNNEIYESILKNFERESHSFSNNEIDEDKIKILIKIDILLMTEENLLFVRENYRNLLTFFIINNIQDYSEMVNNNGDFNKEELLIVLNGNVEDSYKKKMLELTSETISLEDKSYSEAVVLHILEHNFNIDEIDYLLARLPYERSNAISEAIKNTLIKHISTIISGEYIIPYEILVTLFNEEQFEARDKKELLAYCLPQLTDEQAVKSMYVLKMEDFLSLLERKRPTFNKNNVNESILKNLKDREWVSDFNTDKSNANLFRATGRKRIDILALI